MIGGHRPYGGFDPERSEQPSRSPQIGPDPFITAMAMTWMGRNILIGGVSLISSSAYGVHESNMSLNPFDFNPNQAQIGLEQDIIRASEIALPLILLNTVGTLAYSAWRSRRRGY